MTKVKVEVENLRQLQRALRQVEDGADDLKDANAKVAKIVASSVRAAAPRRTGRLASSVKGNRAQRVARISSNLIYAPIQNFGWPGHGIEAQHFAERGVDESRPRWMGAYEKDLQQLARKAERVTA
jgi:phage gpG-like protein